MAAGAVLGGATAGLVDAEALMLVFGSVVAAALILPISTTLAPRFAQLAHALDAKWVKRALAVFLVITSLRMLWTALT